MDHHAHLVFLQPEHLGDFFVKHVVDDLYFEEVVAGAEGAALLGPAEQGVVADQVRVGVVDAAVRLGVGHVRVRHQVAVREVPRPVGQELLQLLFVELVPARPPDSGGHIAEQLLDQLSEVRLHVTVEETGFD